MDFRSQISSIARGKRRILEIGPSYNPIVPKKNGHNVYIVDHADQQSLIEKYQAYGVDTSSIEPVDFVTTDLASLPVEKHSFDLIVATHVIEHTTDLIKFLNDCSQLLSDDGTLALLVPDKRYCFDTFRPLTSPGAVITAHHNQHSRHIGGLLDHYTYFTLNAGSMAWGCNDEIVHKPLHTTEQCKSTLDKSLSTDDYMDAHEWVFTPSSFRFVIQELSAYELTDLRVEQYHDTLGFEFFATLSRNSRRPTEDKLALLMQARHEELMPSALAKSLKETANLLGLDDQDLNQLADQILQQVHCLLTERQEYIALNTPPEPDTQPDPEPTRRWASLARRIFPA